MQCGEEEVRRMRLKGGQKRQVEGDLWVEGRGSLLSGARWVVENVTQHFGTWAKTPNNGLVMWRCIMRFGMV